MSFNTLDAVRRIEAAGIARPQAEAIVDEIAAAQEELFTKADGLALEERLETKIDALRLSTKADHEALRLSTKADIESAKAQLVMWLIGAMIAINGAFSTVLFFALKR
jgi:hypothetical protein